MSSTMKKSTILGMGAVLVFGLSACAIPNTNTTQGPNDRAAVEAPTPPTKPTKKSDKKPAEGTKIKAPKVEKTEAQEFLVCVKKAGTATEKTAVKHVTKVNGANDDGWMAMADVYTDLSGDMFSGDGNTGNLIAAAFTSCWKTDDNSGLVTIYNEAGEMIANDNY